MDHHDNQFNTAVLSDLDLLLGGVTDMVEENRASARRWARVVEIHRRNTARHAREPVTTPDNSPVGP